LAASITGMTNLTGVALERVRHLAGGAAPLELAIHRSIQRSALPAAVECADDVPPSLSTLRVIGVSKNDVAADGVIIWINRRHVPQSGRAASCHRRNIGDG
jgi:hypothetical protein